MTAMSYRLAADLQTILVVPQGFELTAGLSVGLFTLNTRETASMFSNIHSMLPTAAELASQTLVEEGSYRFPSFSAADAVTLGLSIRKRFRGTSRYAKGKGLVISVQTIAGQPLFACTVGDSGHLSGMSDISLDSWSALEGMVNVVKRTGHSSYYVENGVATMGKTLKQMGLQGEFRVCGGAFPIWLENAPCCPIAIAACYSGSSQDDHRLVASTIRDYLNKMKKTNSSLDGPSVVTPSTAAPVTITQTWPNDTKGGSSASEDQQAQSS